MIPPDVASSLRAILPDQQPAGNALNNPVAPTQKIADVLSNLVPGQRIMAEIQALLPNGNYRAVVAQRQVTLALPFSAKAGDSLELEVAESDGKLTLAFVANRDGATSAGKGGESVNTTFSSAGKLIGNLLTGLDEGGKRAAPAPLNGNRALVETMPKTAADLAPVLKQAVSQSGLFYEAHQARWVAGKLPTEALRQEPQGKLPPTQNTAVNPINAGKIATQLTALRADQAPATQAAGLIYEASQLRPPTGNTQASPQVLPNNPQQPSNQAAVAASNTEIVEDKPAQPHNLTVNRGIDGKLPDTARLAGGNDLPVTATRTETTAHANQSNNPIPTELRPIVQQQLDGLATQNFAWQGQVWPGQPMWWEISQDAEGSRGEQAEGSRWHTRLKLNLPELGGLDISLRLSPNGDVGISATTASESSEQRLQAATEPLREQLAAAGLKLSQLLVRHGQIAE